MDNPLKTALFAKKSDPIPRVFETSKKEIGSTKPGDEIQLCLSGKVQSIHDDGRIYVKVSSVELEQNDKELPTENKEKPIYVKTQESHVP